jgi:hypothetical protein
MKASDLEINQLSRQFERLGTCRPAGVGKSMETMIYEALIDLMELAGKITENMDTRSNNLGSAIDCTQHKRMAALHREFSTWYDCNSPVLVLPIAPAVPFLYHSPASPIRALRR